MGKRNGKGKEYNYYGRLIYNGEYLNGKRNGKGIEYKLIEKKELFENFIIEDIFDNDHSEIIFEGEYLYGEKNGKEKNIMKIMN